MSNDLLQESLFLKMIKLIEEGKEMAKGEAIRIWCNTSQKMQEEYIEFFPAVLKDVEKIFEGEKYTENYVVLLTNFISENVLKAYPQIYEMCINIKALRKAPGIL